MVRLEGLFEGFTRSTREAPPASAGMNPSSRVPAGSRSRLPRLRGDESLILMDEPFGALDALTRRFLQTQLLRIWQEHKKTIVFVTHSVPEAVTLSDRIVVMTARPGRFKAVMSVDLAHPRDFRSDEFHALERRVYEELDEELAKTFDLDETDASVD